MMDDQERARKLLELQQEQLELAARDVREHGGQIAADLRTLADLVEARTAPMAEHPEQAVRIALGVQDEILWSLARLCELGRLVGQRLRDELGGQHSLAWLSKKARDTVYARTAAIVMQALNEALGLPGDYYG